MNPVNPKKLQLSKWTAVRPHNCEKHFIVTEVRSDACDHPQICVLEAVHSHRELELDWRELKDQAQWRMGWR